MRNLPRVSWAKAARELAPAGLCAMFVVAFASSEAQAQSLGSAGQQQSQQVTIKPPDPGDPEPPGRLAVYAIALVVGGVAIGLAVMPSRRTHTD